MTAKGTRTLNRLSHLKVSKLNTPGTYEDGGGLRFVVGPTLAKRWVMRVTINGRRRERGLGGFPAVSLESARRKAAAIRSAAKDGQDLARQARQGRIAASVTFRDAFEAFFQIRRQSLSNGKHVKQWVSTMETYVFPRIGDYPVADIRADDILGVLIPIWFEKEETARRVLQRMEAVFRSAILRGNRSLASPCIGVADELGGRTRKVKHHASLPYEEVPMFVKQLRQRQATQSTKLALEFLILTAGRSGEVRKAPWSEIDFDQRCWNIPADRMKAQEPHIVPLSDRTVQILVTAQEKATLDQHLIFPSDSGRALSDMTFMKLIRDMGDGGRATAHGFRSSFKVWAAEVAKTRDEVSEAALAHQIPEKVRAAYLRTQFLEERRPLMEQWASFVLGGSEPANAGCAPRQLVQSEVEPISY